MADEGYDISDYQDIDPRFGTLEDMDTLISEAKKRGIDIVMDLVVNHCSDEHEWFRRACEDPDGPYGDYFYIVDTPADGSLPNNWRSYFGGPCWHPLPGRPDKLYLHVFHEKQPDLNWENPVVREEIFQMINWWFDRGVRGFRIDAIINIKKPDIYTCYAPDKEDGLCSVLNMLQDAKGIEDFLAEMKVRCFDPHNAFTIGEVFSERPDALELFVGKSGYFSSMFDFSTHLAGKDDRGWHACKPVVTQDLYRDVSFASQKRIGDIGFLANLIENHDEPRGVSHYLPKGEICTEGKKMLGGLNFMLRGLPFLYQGQEIGMENVDFHSLDEIDDCGTPYQYNLARKAGLTHEEAMAAASQFSRDNSRTPYQWDATENAGFTTGKPWLKINPNYREINLAAQYNDPDSVMRWYQKLFALRKDPTYSDVIVYGEVIPYCENQHNLMAYYRKTDTQTLLVIGNFQKEAQDVQLPAEVGAVLMNNYTGISRDGMTLHLEPWQFLILEI